MSVDVEWIGTRIGVGSSEKLGGKWRRKEDEELSHLVEKERSESWWRKKGVGISSKRDGIKENKRSDTREKLLYRPFKAQYRH